MYRDERGRFRKATDEERFPDPRERERIQRIRGYFGINISDGVSSLEQGGVLLLGLVPWLLAGLAFAYFTFEVASFQRFWSLSGPAVDVLAERMPVRPIDGMSHLDFQRHMDSDASVFKVSDVLSRQILNGYSLLKTLVGRASHGLSRRLDWSDYSRGAIAASRLKKANWGRPSVTDIHRQDVVIFNPMEIEWFNARLGNKGESKISIGSIGTQFGRISGPSGPDKSQSSDDGLNDSERSQLRSQVRNRFLRHDLPLAVAVSLGLFVGALFGSRDHYLNRLAGGILIVGSACALGWLL